MRKEVTDHLGNVFPSIACMCKHYGISYALYLARIKSGWELDKALTLSPPHLGKEVMDHAGNIYPNKSAMCKQYGIEISTFNDRIRSGWSLEKALTTPIQQHGVSHIVTDHLGNEFPTVIDMCKHWGVNRDYFYHKRDKYSLRDILEKKVQDKKSLPSHSKECTDHLGNKYSSIAEMCRVYNVSRAVFRMRIRRDWSLEKALTEPTKPLSKRGHIDSDGNEYSSIKKLCEAYGISRETYYSRIREGMTTEEAIHTRKRKAPSWPKPATDHLGNNFDSVSTMCKHYGISKSCFMHRVKALGMSLSEALTTPTHSGKRKQEYKGLHGDVHYGIKELCEAYGITTTAYYDGLKKGYTVEEILGKTIGIERRTDHLGNVYPSVSAMCKAYNVSISTYLARVKNGFTVEKALTMPRDNRGRKPGGQS